ncbi:MAG: tRNA (adenosine(37)-N6)-threonylcarbamoyltransferase complex dimerization subunit type 1 TsaB [Planctomycetes bacterium]|nr:tRNA (adenosine(37)-N6)-threonylcarbamoyltransferase complex dimerization subunit type 1 TsaB [Planctomycetota bacterium]
MFTLAIETSGPTGSVALLQTETVLQQQTLDLGRKHAQSLIPRIQQLLKTGQLAPNQLGLIAVSIGPGSYTGLRVGVVTAKAFAFALGIPLVAVDTLEAIAWNAPADVTQLDVIADAQRGDVFVGRYVRTPATRWSRSGPIMVVPASEWAQALPAEQTVTGPGLEKYSNLVVGNLRMLPADSWVPSAVSIGQLGAGLLVAGHTVDVATIEPLYLRRSSAEVQWDRLHPPR